MLDTPSSLHGFWRDFYTSCSEVLSLPITMPLWDEESTLQVFYKLPRGGYIGRRPLTHHQTAHLRCTLLPPNAPAPLDYPLPQADIKKICQLLEKYLPDSTPPTEWHLVIEGEWHPIAADLLALMVDYQHHHSEHFNPDRLHQLAREFQHLLFPTTPVYDHWPQYLTVNASPFILTPTGHHYLDELHPQGGLPYHCALISLPASDYVNVLPPTGNYATTYHQTLEQSRAYASLFPIDSAPLPDWSPYQHLKNCAFFRDLSTDYANQKLHHLIPWLGHRYFDPVLHPVPPLLPPVLETLIQSLTGQNPPLYRWQILGDRLWLSLFQPINTRYWPQEADQLLAPLGGEVLWLSWRDGWGEDRVQICQDIGHDQFTDWCDRHAVKLIRHDQGAQSEQILPHSAWAEEIPRYDLVLDRTHGRIFIGGTIMTAKEIHSQSATISILEQIMLSPLHSAHNSTFIRSSYTINRNEFISKILLPLRRIIHKKLRKNLDYDCHGPVTSFDTRLHLQNFKVLLVQHLFS